MTELRRRNAFEKFFDNRNFLIKLYENNKITKREFIDLNYDAIRKSSIQPFNKIDSVEKGLYNYQYYNSMAKYYKTLAKELKSVKNKNYKRDKNNFIARSNDYYNKKDITTYKLLKFLNFNGVEAYFVETESKYLKGELYEIVLTDYENIIFHSKSLELLEELRNEGIFTEETYPSIISEYINEYY